MSRFGGKNQINIIRFMVQQTGTFNNVYNRGWEMSLDDHSLESIRRRIMGAGRNSQLTSSSFKGIGAGILAPVAEIDERRDLIEMPDGWDRPRCRFMMEVEVETNLGSTDTYFLQGFSEYLGLTASGNLDQKMRWFINGFIRVQYVERSTRRGTETYGVVKSSAQIVNGRLVYDRDVDVHKTRTVDVFSSMQERFFQDGYADQVEDFRTVLASPADSVFSHRSDNLPGNFLSNTINTYRRNIDTQHFGTNTEDVMARTQQELNSDLILLEENPFLSALARLQGRSDTSEFTINDLIDIDPVVGQDGFIDGGELSSKAMARLAYHGGDVSDWRGADLESRWAVQIANAISAIMMEKYHKSFSAVITNRNRDARSIVSPRDAMAVAKGLPIDIFDAMVQNIENLMDDISADGRDQFTVDIQSNLYDQTEIFISIGSEPEQHFFVPSFADSLMSHSYTRDKTLLGDLSSDIERLVSDLGGELSGSAMAVASGV